MEGIIRITVTSACCNSSCVSPFFTALLSSLRIQCGIENRVRMHLPIQWRRRVEWASDFQKQCPIHPILHSKNQCYEYLFDQSYFHSSSRENKKKLYMYTFAFIFTNRFMEKKDILHNIVWCKNRKTSDLCPRITPKAFFRSLTCIQLHFWQRFYVSAPSLLPKTNVLLDFQQTALTIMLWIFENYSFIMEHNETILVNS